ncbi:hypothetical protein, partial [Arhodomonas sp. AD133]|uniref:hypothetical protein n=1 Tax=Arhodomonas sp. AD133 TaxID=3415009 RepID=UPI003EC04297
MRRVHQGLVVRTLACALWLWTAVAAGRAGIEIERSAPAVDDYLLVEQVVDLRVKVLGGHVPARRLWRDGQWQFFPAWQRLRPDHSGATDDGGPSRNVSTFFRQCRRFFLMNHCRSASA